MPLLHQLLTSTRTERSGALRWIESIQGQLKSFVSVVCFGALTVALVGCAGATPKVDNPVLGAAPPRKPGAAMVADASQPSSNNPTSTDDVVNVSFESAKGGDEWNETVGNVDGIPIFARDILEADRPRLAQLKAKAPPEIYAAQREKLMMMRLPQHIEQRLLVAAVREDLTGEQITAVEDQLDELFLDEIDRLKGIAKVGTVAQLEEVLDTQGTTLAQIRKVFFDRQMAQQYLGLKVSKTEAPSRTDLLAEYEKRADSYRKPADVKWQQLWISYEGNGGKSGAFKVLESAVADIKAGVPFDVVIGKYSDGPMKADAGLWDYTTRGNLASKEVDDALFSLPIGEVSRPYDVGNAYQIVRVADRRDERFTPFADVQDQLLTELTRKRQQEAAKEQISLLWRDADVQTRFDDQPEWQSLIEKRYGSADSAE